MKCRIIKKITSPPSHVITSRSRGGGLLHGARGSSFDVTERTPRLVQSCCTKGWFQPPPHTEDTFATQAETVWPGRSQADTVVRGSWDTFLSAWMWGWLRAGRDAKCVGVCLEYVSQSLQCSECCWMFKKNHLWSVYEWVSKCTVNPLHAQLWATVTW